MSWSQPDICYWVISRQHLLAVSISEIERTKADSQARAAVAVNCEPKTQENIFN
jgi:hypothetical protein